MINENSLMEKLAVSKAIMDRHDTMGRGQATETINTPLLDKPVLEDFSTPVANYNIPEEYVATNTKDTTKTFVVNEELILKSKLPDEIKKLMIQNPIKQQNPMVNSTSVLSEEMVEKASKLMGNQKKEVPTRQVKNQPIVDTSDLRKMMKEVVHEVLKENGLILENTSKANETMMIKVGQHIFEGKISKIKKLKQ
jgi:hypothetical protein